MPDAVRTPIGPDARLPTRRTLDERMFVRWPGAYAALSRMVNRLPPRSRLRRALLRRTTLSGWGAWVRGDFNLMLLRYAPDYHWDLTPELVPVGQRNVYQGHAGLREWVADMHDAWERIDVRPVEIVDAGNPVIVLGHVHFCARGSGIEFDYRNANIYWTEQGLIVRQQDFVDWDEALRAAGIPASTADSPPGGRVTSTPQPPPQVALRLVLVARCGSAMRPK